MAYLSGVIEKMLERLGSVKFGSASKVAELEKKFKEVRRVVDDAEDKQYGDDNVKKWVEDLGEFVFKADDLVEEMGKRARSKKQVWINSVYHLTGQRDEIIDDILNELDHLLDQAHSLQYLRSDGDSSAQNIGYSLGRALAPLGEDVYGRDGDKEKIIERLWSENYDGVLSIVGEAGVGKSFLARLVYDDPRVKNWFDYRAWFTVPDEFDPFSVMGSLLEQIIGFPVRLEDHDEEFVTALAVLALAGKKVLLVLNNVWMDEGKLDFLMRHIGSRSRIVVTTLNRRAARGIVYELKALDEDSSWSLFYKVVFTDEVQPEVVEFSKEIVKKCRGIPLIIRAIGGILRVKNLDIDKLRSFYKERLSQVLENENSLFSALRLSYDYLPLFLRHALTYCLLFPKDFEIDVQALVQVWVSHLSLPSQLTTCPEDLGYEWFLGMLGQSFFLETERDEWGNVTKCTLQSSIYDLAKSIVRENAVATLHLNDETSCEKHLRHASFDFHLDSAWQIPTALPKAKTLRTLMLNNQSRWDVEGRSGDVVCEVATKFKFLRMLDLHNSGIRTVPSSIAGLQHLRYLDLSRNVNLKELPKSITSLWNLQTLKLNRCSNLRALPRDIDKLVNLRNLEIESCYSLTHMPRGIGKLTKLRTVSKFVLAKSTTSTRSAKLDELKSLNVLSGKLKIKNLRCPDHDGPKDALLKDKEHLRSLVLIWDIEASTNHEKSLEDLQPHQNLQELCLSSYEGVRFSSWLPDLYSLVKLQLSKCPKCQSLPRLDTLPQLRVLVVDELTDLRFISKEVTAKFFPALEELRLTNLPKLEQCWKDADNENLAFHRLSKLTIENCILLTYMPLFPTVEELALTNTQLASLERTLNWSPASSSSSSSSSSTTVSELKTLRMVNMPRCDPAMLKSLHSLQSLTLDHLPGIDTDFLKKLGNVTTLQELHIWRCDSLKQVSGWIGEIKSLKTLSLRLCPNLIIPSEQISLITSLSSVKIDNCPLASHVESMICDRLYKRKPESEAY